VLGLYETLVKHTNIDTNRVFFYTFSAEALDTAQVLNVKPGICKGAILIVPGAVPIWSSEQLSKVFIAGGLDDDLIRPKVYTNYLSEAAKVGITLRLILQPGVQHLPNSLATERQRAQQFARFLLEN
jgi:hypothetical protein